MHSQDVARTAHRVVLRDAAFRTYATARGLTTPAAIAAAMRVHRTTVTRVLAGQLGVGADFIAGALAAFPAAEFKDLFAIEAVDTQASA